jgi:hypothetical protein
VFAGQKVGVKQTDDHIWLVTFMDYDFGYFDDETCQLEPIDNPFGSKLLPMSPECELSPMSGMDRRFREVTSRVTSQFFDTVEG